MGYLAGETRSSPLNEMRTSCVISGLQPGHCRNFFLISSFAIIIDSIQLTLLPRRSTEHLLCARRYTKGWDIKIKETFGPGLIGLIVKSSALPIPQPSQKENVISTLFQPLTGLSASWLSTVLPPVFPACSRPPLLPTDPSLLPHRDHRKLQTLLFFSQAKLPREVIPRCPRLPFGLPPPLSWCVKV